MKRNYKFMLIVIALVMITVISALGAFYLTSNGYNFQYSGWAYENGTVVRNYSAIQTDNQIQLKFGSLKGKKHYSIATKDYQNMIIEGEITKGELNLSIYDDQNNEVQSLNQTDFPYQLDLSILETTKLNIKLEGDCSGKVDIHLE